MVAKMRRGCDAAGCDAMWVGIDEADSSLRPMSSKTRLYKESTILMMKDAEKMIIWNRLVEKCGVSVLNRDRVE